MLLIRKAKEAHAFFMSGVRLCGAITVVSVFLFD